jgi:hypothetical protein
MNADGHLARLVAPSHDALRGEAIWRELHDLPEEVVTWQPGA